MGDNEYQKLWDKLGETCTKLDIVCKHLLGEPGDPNKPGMVTQLALLSDQMKDVKDKQKSRTRLEVTGVLFLAGLFVTAVWQLVTRS